MADDGFRIPKSNSDPYLTITPGLSLLFFSSSDNSFPSKPATATEWHHYDVTHSLRRVSKSRCLSEPLSSSESPGTRNKGAKLWKRSSATSRPLWISSSWYSDGSIPVGNGWPCQWVQFITSDKCSVRRQLFWTAIWMFVYWDWRTKGLIIQETQAEGGKKVPSSGRLSLPFAQAGFNHFLVPLPDFIYQAFT